MSIAPDFRPITGFANGYWPPEVAFENIRLLSETRIPFAFTASDGSNCAGIIQCCPNGTLQILIPSGSALKVDVISQDEYEAHETAQAERAEEIKAEGP